MSEEKKGSAPADLLGGSLNIFGLTINLGELLASEENLQDRLEELRGKLKQAGGQEALSDEDWRQGKVGITGYVRTRGILGDNEYHIGTAGKPRRETKAAPEPPEVLEPPVDVFDEAEEVTVIADVPGSSLADLELKVEGEMLSLSTKAGVGARRLYRKEIRLEAAVAPETLRATCRNGVLEVHLLKRDAHKGGTASP